MREESGGGASGWLERGDDLAKTRKGKEVRSGIRREKDVTQCSEVRQTRTVHTF